MNRLTVKQLVAQYEIKRISPVQWKVVLGGHHDLKRNEKPGRWSSLAEATEARDAHIAGRLAIQDRYTRPFQEGP